MLTVAYGAEESVINKRVCEPVLKGSAGETSFVVWRLLKSKRLLQKLTNKLSKIVVIKKNK